MPRCHRTTAPSVHPRSGGACRPSAAAQAAELFWDDEQSAEQQVEACATIATQMKFRAKSVLNLPVDKKTRYLVTLPNVSDTVAARALVNYHLGLQRPMMGEFLDALGVDSRRRLDQGRDGREARVGQAARRSRADCRQVSGRRCRAVLGDARLAGSRNVGRARRAAADQRLSVKHQLPISKLQGTSNRQLPNTQNREVRARFGSWSLGVPWKLDVGTWQLTRLSQ